MKKIKLTIILIIVLQLINCTKPYIIDFKDINKRIVLNSFFFTDSVMKFYLTEEASLTDNAAPDKFKIIEDAQIIVFANNTVIDTVSYIGGGTYMTDFFPQNNTEYEVKVKFAGYEDVIAKDKIPNSVDIDSVNTSNSDDNYYNKRVNIFFKDTKNEQNYYLFFSYWERNDPSGNWFDEVKYYTDDLSISEWMSNSYSLRVPIFNDKLFDGLNYRLTVDIRVDQYNIDNHDKCIFVLSSISKNMYLYLKSYNEQTPKYEGRDMLEYLQKGLVEPTLLYSNVEGGLGIFAGCSISQDSIYFE